MYIRDCCSEWSSDSAAGDAIDGPRDGGSDGTTPRSGHRRESENTVQKNIIDSDTRNDNELTLVDLDDLRAAFGGEAEIAGAPEAAAVPPPKTLMCPSW